MASSDRIPTPIAHRWRRFRYNVLPVVSFTAAVMVMLWMWGHQRSKYTTFGKLNARVIDIKASGEGTLAYVESAVPDIPGGYIQVKAGDVIAKLLPVAHDRKGDILAIETARAQIAALRATVDEIRETERLNQLDRDHERERESIRRRWQVEFRRLVVADRGLAVQLAEYEAMRWEAEIVVLRGIQDANQILGKTIALAQLKPLEAQMMAAKEQVKIGKWAFKEASIQLEAAKNRVDDLPIIEADMPKLLASTQALILAQELALKEIQHRLESWTITAPYDGTIAATYAVPGQTVQAGDPILALARDTSAYIIVYVRQDQGIRLQPGDDVFVREQVRGANQVKATVVDVGPQYVLVPEDLRRDPSRAEYGLPTRISIPDGFQGLKPGEVFDVTMISKAS